jgi:uncharacterized protein YidB (DUF937 family)
MLSPWIAQREIKKFRMGRWKEIVGGSDSKEKESSGDLGSTATSGGLDSRMGSTVSSGGLSSCLDSWKSSGGSFGDGLLSGSS